MMVAADNTAIVSDNTRRWKHGHVIFSAIELSSWRRWRRRSVECRDLLFACQSLALVNQRTG